MKKNIFILALAFMFFSCAIHYHLDFLGKEEIEEKVLADETSKNKLLLLNIDGIIENIGSGLLDKEAGSVVQIKSRIERAYKDKSIKGILLRVNSPGGDPVSCETIRNELLKYKALTGHPVVAYFMNLSASGGYYVATSADLIMAHPLAITGSIGVISLYPNVKGLMEKLGISVEVIKTGNYKDSGSPFRDMTGEEKKIFGEITDRYYRRFIEVIAENRKGKIEKEKIELLADGRIFTAEEALENKLVDRTGFLEEAILELKKIAKINDAKVITYTFFPDKSTTIYSASEKTNYKSAFERYFENSFSPGVYYIWLPEVMKSN